MSEIRERCEAWIALHEMYGTVHPEKRDAGHNPPPMTVPGVAYTDALLAFVESEVRREEDRCVKVMRDHLSKAAAVRQAVAQPGMIPELSPERKQEEHRIAAATLALAHPLEKAIRSRGAL